MLSADMHTGAPTAPPAAMLEAGCMLAGKMSSHKPQGMKQVLLTHFLLKGTEKGKKQ